MKIFKVIWISYSVLLMITTLLLIVDYLVTKEFTVGTGLPGELYFEEKARANEINGLLTYFGFVILYIIISFFVNVRNKRNEKNILTSTKQL